MGILVFGTSLALGADFEMTPLNDFRSPKPEHQSPLFESVDLSEAGIEFINEFPKDAHLNHTLLNGSGVALGDFDGDGWCDLYLCHINGSNKLYRNLGNWTFQDVTQQTGTGLPELNSTGAVFTDLNGDSRLDLLVASMGKHIGVLINQGKGQFIDQSADSGIKTGFAATSMALSDVDHDGDLDLYVCNYGLISVLKSGGKVSWKMRNGKPVATGRHAKRIKFLDGVMVEYGEPDHFYLNDGNGKFTPVDWQDGTFVNEDGQALETIEWFQGLAVAFRDYNQDGWPDIYICNDGFMPDRMWLNRGNGTFQATPPLTLRKTSYTSMGVDFADINRDGFDDFFVADMLASSHEKKLTQAMLDQLGQPEDIGDYLSRPQYRRNTLFVNRGDHTFAETAFHAGVAATDWTWSVVFMDADLDGWEDLFITNGFPVDGEDKDAGEYSRLMQTKVRNWRGLSLDQQPPLITPNMAFKNLRNGRFQEVGQNWGFDSTAVSYGMATADLDNDGDLDALVNTYNAAPLLYRNNAQGSRIKVSLKGKGANTQAIGSRILVSGGPVKQSQETISGGRYMAGDEVARVFAANATNEKLNIEVQWNTGGRTIVNAIAPNQSILIHQPDQPAPMAAPAPSTKVKPWFTDQSSLLDHRHRELPFADIDRQPTIDRNLSQAGPGLACFDVNNDGWTDLVVGTGRGHKPSILLNQKGRTFTPKSSPLFQHPVNRDITGIVCFNRNNPIALLTSDNYETGFQVGAAAVAQYEFKRDIAAGIAPEIPSSPGSLAMADIDQDGDLDLFVAGRVIPGQYPAPASSQLLTLEGGRFIPSPSAAATFKDLGMVTAAVFSDLDSDGDPDLIVACDWGSIKVFRNTQGHFKDISADLGLESLKGRWTGLATGDFNDDGRPDILAGNLGTNTKESLYHARGGRLALHYGDFQKDGLFELIPFYWIADRGSLFPIADLEELQLAIPPVRQHFKTHQQYSTARSTEILEQAPGVFDSKVELNTLQSMLFLNQGARFLPVPLPDAAQLSPTFGIAVSDFDADGYDDAFLAQNFFAHSPNIDRNAASEGLLLKGNGQGQLRPITALNSGIHIPGDQRSTAVADFNNDGKADLVIGQNGGETKLYLNSMERRGIRVNLIGSQQNPDAFGASIRLRYPQSTGPRRELQAGNGYLSQNAPTLILGYRQAPAEIEVTWPDGTQNVYPWNGEFDQTYTHQP